MLGEQQQQQQEQQEQQQYLWDDVFLQCVLEEWCGWQLHAQQQEGHTLNNILLQGSSGDGSSSGNTAAMQQQWRQQWRQH